MVLSTGLPERMRWRWTVATKPMSNGGEDGGIIGRVYSTRMKNNKNRASKHGIGWHFNTADTSSAVHFMNDISPTRHRSSSTQLRRNHNEEALDLVHAFSRVDLASVWSFRLVVLVWSEERWLRVSPFIVAVNNGGGDW